jgi:hypothetical protein
VNARVPLQFVSDAALMFKGIQHTFMALKLATVSFFPNSPMSCREFCGFEGSDKWTDYVDRASHSLKEMNDFIDGGAKLTVEGREYFFDVLAGGDQANSHAFNCLGSCNALHPCVYCECTRDNMNQSDLFDFNLRTRTNINILAHTQVGFCKGCNRELGEGDMAKAGDPIPGPKSGAGKWKDNHMSVEYGRHCLLHIEVSKWLICILHANLCIVKGLWEATILANIDLVKNKSITRSQADEIHSTLAAVGVYCKYSKLKKKSKNVSANKHLDQLRSASFHGRDAQNLCTAMPRIIDIVCDPCSKDDTVKEKHAFLQAVWASWGEVWEHLNTYFVDSTANRRTHADKFTVLITKFLTERNSQCLVKQGLYLHILRCHVRPQILEFGCLAPFQVQGLEHCNKIRKEIMHKQTNHRITQTHAVVEGVCNTNAGKSRICQTQEVVLVKSLLINPHEQRQKELKSELSRKRRQENKQKQITSYSVETDTKRRKVAEVVKVVEEVEEEEEA